MLKKTIYSLIFAVILINLFLLSFWLNLKTEKLTPWIVFQLNQAVPKTYTFKLGAARSHLNGLTLESLVLNANNFDSPIFHIQYIELDFNPLTLLLFQEFPFNFRIYGGLMDGRLVLFPSLYAKFRAADIEPNRNKLIRKSNLLLSNPLLNLKGELRLSQPLGGQINLNLKDLILSGKMQYTSLPVDLPATNIGDLDANLTFQNRQLKLLIKSTGDISGNIEGTIQINQRNVQRSNLDLRVTTTLKKNYQKKLGILAELLNNYKNKAGQLSIRIKGTPSYPKIEKM